MGNIKNHKKSEKNTIVFPFSPEQHSINLGDIILRYVTAKNTTKNQPKCAKFVVFTCIKQYFYKG